MVDGFVFYRSFLDAIQCFEDKERLTLYDAIGKYALCGIMPELDGVQAAVFNLIKPQIDANERRAAAAKKGGRPKKQKPNGYEDLETSGNEIEKPKNNNNNKNNNNINNNIYIPSYNEVEDYVSNNCSFVNPKEFYSYYQSNGWKSGTNDVVDWKSAVDWWNAKAKEKANKGQKYLERDYAPEEYNKSVYDPLEELLKKGGFNDE